MQFTQTGDMELFEYQTLRNVGRIIYFNNNKK